MNGGKRKGQWLVLGSASVVIFVSYMMQYQASALAVRLAPEYGIDSVMMANLMFGPLLLAAFAGIPLGALADRHGSKRVVGAVLLVSLCAAVVRVFAPSYGVLLAATVCLGLAPAAMNANMMRLFGAWFDKGLSVAIGVYYAASGLGAMAALYTSVLFPTTRAAFGGAAAILAASAALWWVAVADSGVSDVNGKPNRSAQAGKAQSRAVVESFLKASKSKGMWIVACITGLCLASKTAYLSFMPQALSESMPFEAANAIAMSITVGGIVGCLLGPAMGLAVRNTRRFLVLCAALTAGLMAYTACSLGRPSAIVLFVVGVLSSVAAPLVESIPCRLPELQGVVGSAGGIIGSVSLVATYAIPLGVVAAFGSSPTLEIAAVAGCFALSIPLVMIILK